MPNCAVATCKNYNQTTKGTDVKYFGFPTNEHFAKQWVLACRREDKINLKNATVCSIHFEDKCLEIPLRQRLLNYSPKNTRALRSDSIPTLNLPGGLVTSKKRKSEERSIRLAQKRRKEEVEVILNHSPALSQTINNDMISEVTVMDWSQNENQSSQCHEQNIEGHQTEIDELRQKLNILEKQNNELLKQIEEVEDTTAQKYKTVLGRVFTTGQIKKLLNSDKM